MLNSKPLTFYVLFQGYESIWHVGAWVSIMYMQSSDLCLNAWLGVMCDAQWHILSTLPVFYKHT